MRRQVSNDVPLRRMDVCLDGICQPISNMAPTYDANEWHIIYFQNLARKAHRVQLRPTSGLLRLDKVIVYDSVSFPALAAGEYAEDDLRLQYTGDWGRWRENNALGKWYYYNRAAGNTLSFRFIGTSFSLVRQMSASRADMRVY